MSNYLPNVNALPHSDIADIFVDNQGSNTVSVINNIINKQFNTIPVGIHPQGFILLYPNLYIANQGSNTVSVIDYEIDSVTATVSVGSQPKSMTYDYFIDILYVVNQGSNTVSVINATTNKVVTTIHVGAQPTAISEFLGKIYAVTKAQTQYL